MHHWMSLFLYLINMFLKMFNAICREECWKVFRILYGRNHCFSCDISHWMHYIRHYHWSDVKWIWNWLKRQGDRQLLIDLNEVHAGRMKPISQWLQWLTLQFMHLVFAKGVSSIQPNVWTQWNENQSIEWSAISLKWMHFWFPIINGCTVPVALAYD